jgi:flagellar biosynthetic protein FliP
MEPGYRLLGCAFLLLSTASAMQTGLAASVSPFGPAARGQLSSPMQILLLLTALTLLPAAFVSVTPFLRITLVLHFLRQALGTQSVPSNQVLLGLAVFLQRTSNYECSCRHTFCRN